MTRKNTILIGCMLLAASVSAQQPPKPPGKEERLKHVSERISKEITLTAAQKNKVEAAYKDFFNEMEKLRPQTGKPDAPPPPPPPPPPGKKEEVDKLVKARDAKIKASLSESQYKKYMEIEKNLRPPRPGDNGHTPPPPRPKS